METLEELEFDTIEEVIEYRAKEKAFENGWKEIYELAEQYFDDVCHKNLELSRHLNAEIKNDFACINDSNWKGRLDESCNLVSQLAGISKLKMFICTPIYDETDIALFKQDQEAYEAGKRKAYDAMLDIWIRSCNEQIAEDEQKGMMAGAWNLLKRISALTGYKFDCNNGGIDYESIRVNIHNE